jgi:hypothetical protein
LQVPLGARQLQSDNALELVAMSPSTWTKHIAPKDDTVEFHFRITGP